MKIEFEHKPSAHCENGVTVNLLNHYGIKLSEPLVFGIGSGVFFSHMPFYKVNKMPVTSFRPYPGMIFSRVTKRLGIKIQRRKYRNPGLAMQELDDLLLKGIPVGMLVGVFHLSYFPPEYRMHFNAHNIVVFGKEDGQYLVSDPVMEGVEKLSYNELKRVRFAKGTYPPKGRMYYIEDVPRDYDINKAIKTGIEKACSQMLTIPVPLFGVKGISFLASRLRKWPSKKGDKVARLYLGQVIRMLEEIGTGGAGFRFIYGAFLQEAGRILQNSKLSELSIEMTGIGDKWREFAFQAARNFKRRKKQTASYDELGDILQELAVMEKEFFSTLKTVNF